MKTGNGITMLAAALCGALLLGGCWEDTPASASIAVEVALTGVVQVGGASGASTTTGLELTFSADPATLTAAQISVGGATKGALTGTGTTRTLTLSAIGVADGGSVSVTVASPAGYAISGSPRTVVVYKQAAVDVDFTGVVQAGGVAGTATTTALTLAFSADPTSLTAADISVSGATKGALTGTGTTRTLALAAIGVADGGSVSVTVASPAGYAISGSPRAAVVYKAPARAVGEYYGGGRIAYLLQPGDPGFAANQPHGLIAADNDFGGGVAWARPAYLWTPVAGTGGAVGAGGAATALIIAQNGAGTDYAAGLARDYNGGGYGDWSLPSSGDLYKLYLNRTAIGMAASGFYWTSTQDGGTPGNAVFFDFTTGTGGSGTKSNAWKVRPVRYF